MENLGVRVGDLTDLRIPVLRESHDMRKDKGKDWTQV